LAKDSLDNRVINEHNKIGGQGSANNQHVSSVDDITGKKERKKSGLEGKVDKSNRFTIGRFLWDTAKFAPYIYGISKIVQGAFTPLITVGGFILGNLFEAKRNKSKVNYKDMRKDIRTAALLGATDYWFWKVPDIIPNATLIGKIAKTLFAVPFLGLPYLYSYLHALNLRENYIKLREKNGGISTLFKFLPKIPSYMKDYNKEAIKNTKKNMKQLMMIWPTYFVGFNFLKNIYHRIGVSVFNNFFLRVITGKKKEDVKYSKKAEAPNNNQYHSQQYTTQPYG